MKRENPADETPPSERERETATDLSRRAFLRTAALAGAGAVVAGALPAAVLAAAPASTAGLVAEALVAAPAASPAGKYGTSMIDTVLGPVRPDRVGKVLAHEHLYVDFMLFNGLDDPHYMKPVGGFDAAIDIISKYVLDAKAQGVELIVDWGCLGVGRSVSTALKVAHRTGVNVALPTGIYKSLREAKFAKMTVDQLSDYFVGEFKHGMDGTGVKPAFIKMGASPVPSTVEVNIHRAATQAAAEVGATVACHLPFAIDARTDVDIARARQVWAIARANGVKPDRFVWGHAQGMIKYDKADAAHLDVARGQYFELASEGVTIQFDAVGSDPKNGPDPWFGGPTDPAVFLDLIETFVTLGYGDRVMISNDASVYANPGGGQGGEQAADYAAAGLPNWQYPRDIRYVFGTFAPMLIARVGNDAAMQILRTTPARVFSRVRTAKVDH